MRTTIIGQSGLGEAMPPAAQHVKIYMEQKGFKDTEIELILKTILLRGWKTQTGRPVQNWKQYLFEWQYILKYPHKKVKRKLSTKQSFSK